MNPPFYLLSLVCAFALGALTSSGNSSGAVSTAAHASAPADPPAYLMAVGTRLKPPEALAAYRQAAGPLAMAAGYQLLATQPTKATVQVLEGQWPYEGFVTLEKFTSMKDVLNFWNSDGYQSAKKLRADAIKMDFIIAVEGGR
ncbi:MAG: DUF1330 domain-containing protein [Acidobacteriota bacterium]